MSKKGFLAAARRSAETVTIDKIGQTVQIKRITHGEMQTIFKAVSKTPDATERGLALQRKIIAAAVVFEGDEQLTEEEVSMGLDLEIARDLFDECARVNGLDKKVEAVEGN